MKFIIASLFFLWQVPTGSVGPFGGGGPTVVVTPLCQATPVTGTSITCTLSPNPSSGSTLVVILHPFHCTVLSPTMGDNQSGSPNTYTLETVPTVNASNACVEYWVTGNLTVNTTPMTITFNAGTADFLKLHVAMVTPGIASTNPANLVDVSGTVTTVDTTTTTGSVSPNSVTTTNAHDVVFGAFGGIANGSTVTPGTSPNYTLLYADGDLSLASVSLDDIYINVSSTGTFTPNLTWALPQGSGYAAQAIAIKGM